MMKFLTSVFLFFLVSCLLYSCVSKSNNQKDDRTVFKYNESSGITSLDPAFAKDQATIWAVNQLYNGLVQMNEKMKVIPCIAKLDIPALKAPPKIPVPPSVANPGNIALIA